MKLLNIHEILIITKLSRSTIATLIKSNRFPPPLKLSHVRLWRLSDIESWMASLEPKQI